MSGLTHYADEIRKGRRMKPPSAMEVLLDDLAKRITAKMCEADFGSGSHDAKRPRLMSIDEAAKYLGRSPSRFYVGIALQGVPDL